MRSIPLKFLYKILFGLLGLSAVVTEIVVLVNANTFDPGNFFSYFTILGNIFAFIMLFVGAYVLISARKSRVIDGLRGAATLYMVVTGIVFATLLAGIEGATFTAVPWDNVVLHYIMPVALLVDWLIDRPTNRVSYKTSLLWLIVPLAYVIYTLIRGPIVQWYPYPFLNPEPNGYGAVLVAGLGIAIVCIVGGLLLVRVSRRKS